MHLDVLAGVDASSRGRGRSRPAGGHGVERRRPPDQQADHVHRPVQGGLVDGGRGQLDFAVRADRHAGRPGAVVRRHARGRPNAPIELFWNNSPMKDAARVKTPTLFLRRARTMRACRCRSRSRCTARSVPTACRRGCYVAPREGHQWGELRHQLFKANAELEWFERYVDGRTYTWERAPATPSASRRPSRR